MAGIVANRLPSVISGAENPNLSRDLNAYDEVVTVLSYYDRRDAHAQGAYGGVDRMPIANRWAIVGDIREMFKADYYERIHILPTRIELGTVASTVSREVSVWNAYTTQSATLDAINILNGSGVSVAGLEPPIEFTPLQERTWEVRISPNGPPEINAQIHFDFGDVEDPLPIVIVGNRAVVLPAVPDVPVIERWRWMTDVHVANDGSEQRVGLRRVPRRQQVTKLAFESASELRDQYRTLFSAAGRLFIPYFQYGTTVTQSAPPGADVLVFDTALVDLRADDYVLLIGVNFSILVQLDSIGATSASLKAPLSALVPKGTKVIAIFPSLIPNNLQLNRPAVNNYGTMNMTSEASYPRASHVRPGASAPLRYLDGIPVLERRPLANDEIGYTFDAGLDSLDAKIGIADVMTDWDFARVDTAFSFNVRRMGRYECTHRTGVDEMDYWRAFTDKLKGSLNAFLLSSYRPDQLPAATVSPGADSMILSGPSYTDNFWPALPYHYLSINTAAGAHLTKVLSATKNSEGDSVVTFSPALPAAPAFADIRDVSYLLKQRIADDTVELEHYAIDTVIKITSRTSKE